MNPQNDIAVMVETELGLQDFMYAQAKVLILVSIMAFLYLLPSNVTGLLRFFLVGDPVILLTFALVSTIFATLWYLISKQTKSLQKKVHYLFTGKGVDFYNETSNGHLEWAGAKKLVETKQYFLLYIDAVYFILPKRFFLQPDDLSNFRNLARTALGDKAQLQDRPVQGLSKVQSGLVGVGSVLVLACIVPPHVLPSFVSQYVANDFMDRGYKFYQKDIYTQARKEFDAAILLRSHL